MGIFHAFRDDEDVELIGVEAAAKGSRWQTCRPFCRPERRGRIGVLHGTKSYVMQTEDGQIARPTPSAPG
jgi:tryptophan synthase beta chain